MLERREFLQRAAVGLVVLMLLVSPAVTVAFGQASRATSGTIRGTLKASDRPIADAELILQSFEDERCAKLFKDKKPSQEKIARLIACSKDLPPIRPNAEGVFKFENLRPGWYALRFLWNIEPKPDTAPLAFSFGRFVVMHAGSKDESGRYDTLTQGGPFYFSGETDVVVDFAYRKK